MLHDAPSDTTRAPSWIQKTPGVCGGDARLRNTRITVRGLVSYRNLGLTDSALLSMIEGLTPADLAVAWDYYAHHKDEIDDSIRENEDA